MQTPQSDPCKICGTANAQTFPTTGDRFHQQCTGCGEFLIIGPAGDILRYRQTLLPKVRGWISDQTALGMLAEITSERITLLEMTPLPSVAERAERLLRFMASKEKKLGDGFDLRSTDFVSAAIAASYSQDAAEVGYLIMLLREQDWIQNWPIGSRIVTSATISPRGYVQLAESTKQRSLSTQAFVAMSFNEDLRPYYEAGIEPAIKNAGYDCLRVDSVEHSGRIDDEIVRQIRQSRFIVADFTEHRGGVYFEAGFALGLGLPVIWTCRSNCIKDLHFDTRQYNCVEWSDANSLAAKLQRRIEAVLGRGPR